MKLTRVQIYVGVIVVLALGAAVNQDWPGLYRLLFSPGLFPWPVVKGWTALLLLGIMAEHLTLSIKVGRSAGTTNSINFLPLLTSILLFGPVPTVLFWGITGVIGEFFIRKKETIRAVFNSAQYVLATSVAGWVYAGLGGEAFGLMPELPEPSVWPNMIPFAAFGFTFLVLNHTAVSLAIALSEGSRPKQILATLAGRTGTNLLYDLFISPLAVAVAVLYLRLGIPGLPLIILPLFFISQAYQTIGQLQQSNRDILTALVKAIETRDPYTSGHSLRVASLAVHIAEGMGMTGARVRDVEMAALLHDIGKIDAVYTELLGKPGDLTPEEREVIESHVTKGVELLEQLSSFSKEVIAGVRGHHERVDGKGYPLGLKGEQIPPAARIIKVCDSIDAMLSDRSYRKALALPQVKEQLVIYSGVQFDLEVVKTAIAGDILERHRADILEQKRSEVSSKISQVTNQGYPSSRSLQGYRVPAS